MKDNHSTVKSLLKISRIGSYGFALSIFGATLSAVINYGYLFIIGKVTQEALNQASSGIFNRQFFINIGIIAFAMIPLLVVMQSLNLLGGQLASKLLKRKILSHAIRMDESYSKNNHSGAIMNLATNDADVVDNFYFQGINNMIVFPLIYGGASLITCFVVDVRFGIISTVIGFISLFWTSRYSDRIQKGYVASKEANEKATTELSEILANEELIRLNNGIATFTNEYDNKNKEYEKIMVETENMNTSVRGIGEGFSYGTTALFLAVGLFLSMQKQLDFSLVMLLLPLQTSISMMFLSFSTGLNFLSEVATSAIRILEFLGIPLEDKRLDAIEYQVGSQSHSIVLDNLSFGYNSTKTVLKNLNLTINRGETVALVGESGSGKSTLLQLLLGFYMPQQGSLKVMNQDTRSTSLASLRDKVIYVQQEAPLFNLTIRENIELGYNGLDKPTLQQVQEAARKAAIHDFIQTLPDGYDTKVGENANRISGGQRQRIAIARAFMSDAPIILMDEPTAALDSESETLIQEALQNIRKEKTVIIAAHRLRTIRDADKIVVLENGVIEEVGNHDSLLDLKSRYYNYVLTQEKA